MLRVEIVIGVVVIAVAIGLLAKSAHGEADAESQLRAMMGVESFAAAGLHKLEPGELQALQRWLEGRQAVRGPRLNTAPGIAMPVEELPDEVRATIEGPFTGWSGKTYFALDNGQIWQQRNPGRHEYEGADVAVRIYKNSLGFHVLQIVETGRTIGVRRVQ